MLIRISLILAIIAGLAAGALNFVKVKEKITTLITERDDWHQKFTTTDNDLRKTKKDLEVTKKDLETTKSDLATANNEKAAALAEAAKATQRATQMAEDLSKTKTELGDAQAGLERYRITGLTAEQVAALGKTLKDTQTALAGTEQENKVLGKEIVKLNNELAVYRGSNVIVYLPPDLNGKVLVSDPKWDFVVLNIGEDQGVLPMGELLVSRDGKLVAKVIVRSIQKDRSIANVMPGWKLGELLEGDMVIPAHPRS